MHIDTKFEYLALRLLQQIPSSRTYKVKPTIPKGPVHARCDSHDLRFEYQQALVIELHRLSFDLSSKEKWLGFRRKDYIGNDAGRR